MIILNLDSKSEIPLYIQIYNEIKKLIQVFFYWLNLNKVKEEWYISII